jgi:hypothetical protein
MDFRRAFYCGVIGGLITSLGMFVGRSVGITELNVELLLGSMLTGNLSILSDVIGEVLYLLIAGLIACLYAVGFVYVTERDSWAIGQGRRKSKTRRRRPPSPTDPTAFPTPRWPPARPGVIRYEFRRHNHGWIRRTSFCIRRHRGRYVPEGPNATPRSCSSVTASEISALPCQPNPCQRKEGGSP